MTDRDWREMDRATRSAAYDNRAAFPASATDKLKHWQALSAAMRADHRAELDLRYGPKPRNRLDIFPADTADAPMLVFIHGGWWQRNSKDDFTCMGLAPLAKGLAFANVGYTLAPDASLSDIVAEIHAALDILAARDADAGIRRRTIVAGWSAGGHLAALVSSRPDIDATLAISGIYDLEPVRGTEQDDPLGLTAADVEGLSPMRHASTLRGPLVIAYGTQELPEFCRQSRSYRATCVAHGLPATLLPIENADHFTVLDALLDPSGELTDAVLALAG